MSWDLITDCIADQGYLLLDGGLATELEAQGHDLKHRLWSARLLQEDPEAIREAHLAFLMAGADCLITSSYQATPQGLAAEGYDRHSAIKLIRRSHQLARDSCERFSATPEGGRRARPPVIAASIGPYGAFLADGSEYRGNYRLGVAELVAFHRERFELLAGLADLLAIETLPDLVEAAAIRELLVEDGTTPAWVSFTCRDGGHLAGGQAVGDAAKLFTDVPQVRAVGVNCSEPRHVLPLIAHLRSACPDKEIVVYPNSGERYCADAKTWSAGTPGAGIADLVVEWLEAGARMIGGCCRVTAADLAAINQQLRG